MKTKHSLVIGLVLVLLFSNIASAKPKITVWLTYGGTIGKVISDLIHDDFTPKTGIEVEYVPMKASPFELMTKLILEILGGSAPDICFLEGYQVIELGMRGVLETMNQFSDYKEIVNRFYPGFSGQFIYNNKVYAIPGESGWTQSYVRTDIFKDLGLEPAVLWDDLDKIIPKLKARDKDFYYENAMGYPRAYMAFLFQRGEDIFTKDGLKSNLDSPEAIKAFKTYTSLYTKNNIPVAMPDIQCFVSGTVPYMVHLHYIYGLIDNIAPQIKGKWAPVHTPGTKRADGKISNAIPTSSFAYVIPKIKGRSKENKEAAWEFLKWYTSAETVAKIQKGFFEGPDKFILMFGTKESFNSAKFLPEHRNLISEVLEQGVKMTSIPGGFSTYRYIDFAFNRVVLQNENPETALKEAAKDSTQELERKRKEFARFLKDM